MLGAEQGHVLVDLEAELVGDRLEFGHVGGDRSSLTNGEADIVEGFKDLVGRSRQEVATALVERFGLEEAARARMAEFGVKAPWQAYVRVRLIVYDRLLADPDLIESHRYPHNVALLQEVRRLGYPTGLATMSHTGQARRVLGILGLADEFDVVATRDDVENGKPDPEIDLLVAREFGVEPGECLKFWRTPRPVWRRASPPAWRSSPLRRS